MQALVHVWEGYPQLKSMVRLVSKSNSYRWKLECKQKWCKWIFPWFPLQLSQQHSLEPKIIFDISNIWFPSQSSCSSSQPCIQSAILPSFPWGGAVGGGCEGRWVGPGGLSGLLSGSLTLSFSCCGQSAGIIFLSTAVISRARCRCHGLCTLVLQASERFILLDSHSPSQMLSTHSVFLFLSLFLSLLLALFSSQT